MSLAALLLDLQPLIADPAAHFTDIVALLGRHQGLAEYEVARFWASDRLLPAIRARCQSLDPRERAAGARAVGLICTRRAAAQLLRPLCKDLDYTVRSAARHAVRRLDLDEVALPDGRYRTPRQPHRRAIGGWNSTGWAFGLYRPGEWERARKPKAPPRSEELARQGLPPLPTVAALCKLVGLKKPAELQRFLRPGVGAGSGYVEFTIEKQKGGERRISAPRAPLRRVQRVILRELLDKLPAHEAAHGFVRGRSVVSNARPHEGARVVIKLDLKDFFPTIHYRRVVGLFEGYGYGEEVARALAGLCTHRPTLPDGTVLWPGVLPQGAPTSPQLANLLCRRLDARLSGVAEAAGAAYTRYADDLTFSFSEEPAAPGLGRFLWWVEQVCQQEGFVENAGKRRVLRRSGPQRVTGVMVNAGLRVPREARRRFRAILANCRKHGVESQSRGRKDFRAYLLGFAAYVKMVQPELGARLLREVKELLRR